MILKIEGWTIKLELRSFSIESQNTAPFKGATSQNSPLKDATQSGLGFKMAHGCSLNQILWGAEVKLSLGSKRDKMGLKAGAESRDTWIKMWSRDKKIFLLSQKIFS